MALLVLAKPVELSPTVKPIEIASVDTGAADCFIAGWGRLSSRICLKLNIISPVIHLFRYET